MIRKALLSLPSSLLREEGGNKKIYSSSADISDSHVIQSLSFGVPLAAITVLQLRYRSCTHTHTHVRPTREEVGVIRIFLRELDREGGGERLKIITHVS